MYEVGDAVNVKMREPIGSPTTDTANRYLKNFVDRCGTIYEICNSPIKDTYRVIFPHEAGHYINIGVFEEFELEKVEA